MNIIRSSLKYNQISLVTIFLIFAVGIYALLTMPRRSDPEITIRQALVIAVFPGATAVQVEKLVAKPIEDKLFTYSEIKKDETCSNIYDGLVVITVTLEDFVETPDLFWEKLGQGLFQLSRMSLPNGVLGPLVDSDFGDVVALLIAVESDTYSYDELKDYIEVLENQLRQVKSVSKIDLLGYRAEEIEVAFNSATLAQFNMDKANLIEALQTQNTITYSGYIESDYAKVTLYTTGLFTQVDQIRELIVGISPEGSVVRMKDVADVRRKLTDPSHLIRVNGSDNRVMLISMEMQDGYNIVEFGKEVDQVLEETKILLPSGITFTTINNQPEVVQSAVNDFMREFLIAVIAVILTIMLMLPLNIALIASISIPVSIGMTFTFLNLFGYELQQVSLASLIVVLGMVVDNAVVVIDAYVDKLDRGISRFEAAWKSATEFSIPLISSTLAIIMAFLPLVFLLSGATGQFLITLPITVAISMICSLFVAFFLTPFLAYLFIKKGLAKEEERPDAHELTGKRKKFSLLGGIQTIFNRLIEWAMKRKWLTIGLGAGTVVLGVLIMNLPKQQFFPPAERNQFVIQIFEPLGTKFAITDAHVKEIEEILVRDPEITGFAAFIGTSAPRVYYSFAPVFPIESYAMFLVNTPGVKETEKLAVKYAEILSGFIPNARVDVMQFAQGVPVNSPVEVRLYGNDIHTLKALGENVKEIFRDAEGSTLIRQDFEGNYYLNVAVNEEV
ncbi:MAG: efflux RND transporter permease subunit, partial [Bacteroidota bacterium]